MAERSNILEWIGGLAGAAPQARANAAFHLHLAGVHLCHTLLHQWMGHSEFRDLATPARAAEPGDPDADKLHLTVGIAVLPATFDSIRAASGSPRLADVPPDQDAKEFELHFEDHTNLDILTTRDPSGSGAIARYLQKFGEGIQQVEITVRDVTRATEILRDNFSLPPIYPETRFGADGTRVNFFLAADPQGQKVLIELVEENRS
jgi:hypothetical protein